MAFRSPSNVGPTLASVVDNRHRRNSLSAARAIFVYFCDVRSRGSAFLGSANAVWLGTPGQPAPSADRRKPTKLHLCLSGLIAMIMLHLACSCSGIVPESSFADLLVLLSHQC